MNACTSTSLHKNFANQTHRSDKCAKPLPHHIKTNNIRVHIRIIPFLFAGYCPAGNTPCVPGYFIRPGLFYDSSDFRGRPAMRDIQIDTP